MARGEGEVVNAANPLDCVCCFIIKCDVLLPKRVATEPETLVNVL